MSCVRGIWPATLALGVLLAGCAPTAPPDTAPGTPPPTAAPSTSPAPTTARPFDAAAARTTVERLAALGPREATGPAYAEAAELVQTTFEQHGYRVSLQEFDVPAGTSWGIAVPAGRTVNVVADLPGFDPSLPQVIIGAHLDTVPQAPGAEDNASGVAVMLELARMVAELPAGLPVRFIAFGAEEPRGSGDSRHHYGSQRYVADLGDASREAITAMVALDRVGVGSESVPLAHGGRGTDRVRRQLAEAAAEADAPVHLDTNTTSDHWSFEKAGIPAARIGSVPYAGYHSAGDVPAVVDDAQLARVGTITWSWLRSLES
jgi:Zn-dependent M28 family amino/carboxypeptidase